MVKPHEKDYDNSVKLAQKMDMSNLYKVISNFVNIYVYIYF